MRAQTANSPGYQAIPCFSTALVALISHLESGLDEATGEAARQLESVAAIPGLDDSIAMLATRLAARCRALGMEVAGSGCGAEVGDGTAPVTTRPGPQVHAPCTTAD